MNRMTALYDPVRYGDMCDMFFENQQLIHIALVCCLGANANCICTVAISQIPVTKIIHICNKTVNTVYICTIMDVILVPFAPLCAA